MYLKPSIGQFHQTTESQRILPARLPTLFNLFLVFLHCKPSLVRFCKSLHICNSTVIACQKWKGLSVFTISINCFFFTL